MQQAFHFNPGLVIVVILSIFTFVVMGGIFHLIQPEKKKRVGYKNAGNIFLLVGLAELALFIVLANITPPATDILEDTEVILCALIVIASGVVIGLTINFVAEKEQADE